MEKANTNTKKIETQKSFFEGRIRNIEDNLADGKPVNYTKYASNLVFDSVNFTQYGQVIFANSSNLTITNSNFTSNNASYNSIQ